MAGDALELIKEDTHTCYMGDHSTRHEWGCGCAACPACHLRARGYGSVAEQAFQEREEA